MIARAGRAPGPDRAPTPAAPKSPLKGSRKIVCMISHTRINRDARVARTAEALLRNGFQLHLICLANEREPKIPAELEGATLYQIQNYRESSADLRRRADGSGDPWFRHPLGKPAQLAEAWRVAVLRLACLRYVCFYWKSLWYACRARAPSVVHCHDLNVLPVGFVVSLLRGSVLIYDSHEIFTEKVGLRLQWFWRRLERFLIGRCHLVITTTEARAKVLQERYPHAARPAVIHNYPASRSGENEDIRRLAGLPPEAFVALYQGGLQPHRGLETMIESARYAKDVVFVIHGDGPLYADLRQLITNSAGLDNVRLLPGAPYEKMRAYTASADVGLQILLGVSLNHTTTLSNKFFEYIHAGLPVIASDFPMLRQYVEKYGFGLLVNPGDPVQLAQALLRLHENPAERLRLAEKARAASRILNWENEHGSLLELYRESPAEVTEVAQRGTEE